MYDLSKFFVKPQVLRYYTPQAALERLVDFDLIQEGEAPEFNPSWATMDRAEAKRLYLEGFRSYMAEFVVMADEHYAVQAARIFSFVQARGRLNGLESLYLTSLGILEGRGHTESVIRARKNIGKMPELTRLGGGEAFGMYFRTSDRTLLGLPRSGILEMLNPMRGDLVLLATGVDKIAGSKYETVASGSACETTVIATINLAGGILGRTYGPEAGATLGYFLTRGGGAAAGVAGAMVGHILGTKYGAELGGFGSALVSPTLADLVCGGGSTPNTGTGSPTPASGPSPGPPAPAPSPSPRAADPIPSTPHDVGPMTGGPADDPPQKDPDDKPPEMVARLLPDDEGGGGDPRDPSDTPGHVVHPLSFAKMPPKFVNRFIDPAQPGIGQCGEFPRFVHRAKEEEIHWGNHGSLAKSELNMLFGNTESRENGPAIVKKLWDEVVNPKRYTG